MDHRHHFVVADIVAARGGVMRIRLVGAGERGLLRESLSILILYFGNASPAGGAAVAAVGEADFSQTLQE